MPIQINEDNGGKILAVHVTGKLTKADYERFVPEFERLVRQNGKARVLFEMSNFHGWDGSALRDEINFDLDHLFDIDRLAMVGDKKWEQIMSVFCKPFTTATIRYFDHMQAAKAREWLDEGDGMEKAGKQ